MSYSRPAYNAAYATFDGLSSYTREAYNNSWATFEPIVYTEVDAYVAAASPLGAPQLVVSNPVTGVLSIASVLQAPALLGDVVPFGQLIVGSPLGTQNLLCLHDFTIAPSGAISKTYVYLVTPGGDVRVPASSCQGTVQLDETGYLQAVIQNAGAYIDDIEAATEFYVTRVNTFAATEVEIVVARAALDNVSLAQGSLNYSAAISGSVDVFPDPPDPLPAAYERDLRDIRVVFSANALRRVRCGIDWLLRPGFNAVLFDSTTFPVDYINFYMSADSDHFMDVGERSS